MSYFTNAFLASFALNATLCFRSSDLWKRWFFEKAVVGKKTADKKETEWKSLIFRYLAVYLLATAADWLQGAYVFILYHAYQYSQYEIAVLFIMGFGSSALCGTMIGSMADRFGRRTFVVVYSVVYALSCITKHFRNFYLLLFGRFLGGIATSLLFSIFEAWLIKAHADANLHAWISKSFTWAAYGNSIVAIISGLVANHAAENSTMESMNGSMIYAGGYLEPFDMALVAAVACGIAAIYCWEENYGETDDNVGSSAQRRDCMHCSGSLRTACRITFQNREILLCGIVSSLYEGSMYIFIFMWTPALMQHADENSLPFGLIFSTFMVCAMAGSSLFSIFNDYFRLEYQALLVLVLAALSMLCLLTCTDPESHFIAMNLFEVTIGMYFPVIGCLKCAIVPESSRAAIYNLYRIPLNVIVLLGLLANVSPWQAFLTNLVMLVTASAMQLILIRCREKNISRAYPLKFSETESLSEESTSDNDTVEPLLSQV